MPYIFNNYLLDDDGNFLLDDDGNYIVENVPSYDFNAPATPYQNDYQVAFISPTTGATLDILDQTRIQQLSYTRIINDIGDFMITINGSDRAVEYASILDLIVEIYRVNSLEVGLEKEGTYFSRYFNIFEGENGQEYVVISGYSLEHLIGRRIIRPEDDPTGAGGFSTKFGAADTVMTEFVDNQCVDPANDTSRIIPGLTVAGSEGIGYLVFPRESYTNLLDVLKQLAIKGDIDFRIRRTTGLNFVFESLVIGSDRRVSTNYPTDPSTVFDPRRLNMLNPNLTIDRKNEKTFAYVLGQGIEDERYVYPVRATEAGDSPFNRIEVTTDARNQEDDQVDGLIAAGTDVLSNEGIQIAFDFEPDLNAPQGRYNIDWQLGDKVTVNYKTYQNNLRFFKVSIEVNAEGQTITPELQKIDEF